jgi:hypothetical protein
MNELINMYYIKRVYVKNSRINFIGTGEFSVSWEFDNEDRANAVLDKIKSDISYSITHYIKMPIIDRIDLMARVQLDIRKRGLDDE